jgi:hypothetical protein
VDEGFSRWKGGNSRGALDSLVEGLTAIDRLPADDADEKCFSTAKARRPHNDVDRQIRCRHATEGLFGAAAGSLQ